jgi:hypothetical protein
MRHSRTHHLRTSRNTHPRGCSSGLATVRPVASPTYIMQLATHFRQSLVRFAVRLTEFLDLRPTDPTYSQGSCGRSVGGPRVGLVERAYDKGVGLGAGAPPWRWQTKGATRGVPTTTSSGLSATTRRYDQPDQPHRDKPVFRFLTCTCILHGRRRSHPLPPRGIDRPVG